jgi:TfoX/Sxy family transcriptional regulator of competence genes
MNNLETRVDELSAEWGMTKKKMFGGQGYMINGNMAFAIRKKGDILLRSSSQDSDKLLKQPGIKLMEMHGRTMKNWLIISPEAVKIDDQLLKHLEIGKNFASTLSQK